MAKMTVEGESKDEILDLIGAKRTSVLDEIGMTPEEWETLKEPIQFMLKVFRGLTEATEEKATGRSRSKIHGYGGITDVEPWVTAQQLSILKKHGIAEQNDRRWLLADRE